jgi:hypothetical protein
MMNQKIQVNLIPKNTKIATVVSNNDVVSYVLPLSRSIELLIDPSIKSKRGFADNTSQLKILVSLFKSL